MIFLNFGAKKTSKVTNFYDNTNTEKARKEPFITYTHMSLAETKANVTTVVVGLRNEGDDEGDDSATYAELEYSLHLCPKKHKAEAQAMFNFADDDDENEGEKKVDKLIIVPTCQKTAVDIIKTGERVDEEKDLCLERFMKFAEIATGALREKNFWCDYIDPCSGLSMIHRDSQRVYGEVDALVTLLNYECTNVGCCKIVMHPKWGSSVYPASLFAIAPEAEVKAALELASEKMKKR